MLVRPLSVVMGYCHAKIYSSISIVHRNADEALDEILALYRRSGVSLADLGVYVPTLRHRPGRLDAAVAVLSRLAEPETELDLESQLSLLNPASIAALADDGVGSHDADPLAADVGLYKPPVIRSGARVRTPLDAVDTFKRTIDEIGKAAQRSQLSSSRASLHAHTSDQQAPLLSTDDLLPVLAYVVVQAAPAKLVSLLYYVQTFRLGDPLSPDLR